MSVVWSTGDVHVDGNHLDSGGRPLARDHHQYAPGCPSVLLLDDDPSVRESLGRYFERSGFSVVRAATAEEALSCVQVALFDAFVLDVRLPGHRSGLEVLELIRLDDEGPDRPVIVLTGNILTDAEEDIIRRDEAYVFYKPHGYGDLVAHLRRLCGTAVRATG